MFPGNFVATTPPDKPAVIRPSTGERLTYRELDERSTRLARHLRSLGLKVGDHLALVSSNDLRVLEVYWAALRSGLYITVVNWHLTPPEEAGYVVDDCGAEVLIVSADAGGAVPRDPNQLPPRVRHRLVYGGVLDGFDSYDDAVEAQSAEPLDSQPPRGQDMLYSSGTTGRPKGIKPALPEGEVDTTMDPYTAVFAPMYGFDSDTVYLCPAPPLYHAAPLRFCGTITSVGGTIVLMDRFDAEESLRLIEEYRVTHSQWVPTMFVRMLKLPKDVRDKFDVSSLKVAIHAAAPCPPDVKLSMIEWWGGPVIHEYYASTEGAGATFIDSARPLPSRDRWATTGSWASCTSATTTVRTYPSVTSEPSTGRGMNGRSYITTTRPRPNPRHTPPTIRPGPRAATSGTSTPTASSTSPTAPRS